MSSQVETTLVEEKHVQQQTYLLIYVVGERGALHDEIKKDQEDQGMVTSPSNSQDHISTGILSNIVNKVFLFPLG